jgi:hypothetical protein
MKASYSLNSRSGILVWSVSLINLSLSSLAQGFDTPVLAHGISVQGGESDLAPLTALEMEDVFGVLRFSESAYEYTLTVDTLQYSSASHGVSRPISVEAILDVASAASHGQLDCCGYLNQVFALIVTSSSEAEMWSHHAAQFWIGASRSTRMQRCVSGGRNRLWRQDEDSLLTYDLDSNHLVLVDNTVNFACYDLQVLFPFIPMPGDVLPKAVLGTQWYWKVPTSNSGQCLELARTTEAGSSMIYSCRKAGPKLPIGAFFGNPATHCYLYIAEFEPTLHASVIELLRLVLQIELVRDATQESIKVTRFAVANTHLHQDGMDLALHVSPSVHFVDKRGAVPTSYSGSEFSVWPKLMHGKVHLAVAESGSSSAIDDGCIQVLVVVGVLLIVCSGIVLVRRRLLEKSQKAS